MKQKIVIISNYYPPEMGAAANRIKNLAEALFAEGNEVTVVCPLPNYPKGEILEGYKNRFSVEENRNGILVKRYWLFSSNSKNSIIRILSMLSFAFTLWGSVFSVYKKKPNLFIVQSPPLFVALSGLLMSKFLRIKNVLNVSDLWPLSALELGVIKKGLFYRFFEKIELWNYQLADKIIGQSNEIITHIKTKVVKPSMVYRNTPAYLKFPIRTKEKGKLTIVYAGLLGYAQGVLEICNELDFKKLDTELHIYGEGMEAKEIKNISEQSDKNIFFHGSKNSTEIKQELFKYDVALVPLKNPIFGAVPSKIFELMQLGIPILFFSKGEGAQIVAENSIGFVANSKDYNSLKTEISNFKNLDPAIFSTMSERAIELHKENYTLDIQLKNLLIFIYDK